MSVTSDEVILDWTGSQSVGADSGYNFPWTVETLDASNYWVSGSPTRITVPSGKGGYHFATFKWSASATSGFRTFGHLIVKNSSDVDLFSCRGPLGRNDDNSEVSMLAYLSAGDYITCGVYYASVSRTLVGAHFEMVRFNG